MKKIKYYLRKDKTLKKTEVRPFRLQRVKFPI